MGNMFSDRMQDLKLKLEQYQKDIDHLITFSQDVSNDLVKYVLRIIGKDDNLEISRLVLERMIAKHQPLADILKVIIKVLFFLKKEERFKYGDYFTVKSFIDMTLEKSETTVAKLAKKKYELLLNSMFDAEGLAKNNENKINKKSDIVDDLRDTINKQFIKFI